MFGPFNTLLGLFSRDLGIDLGTANTLVYVKDRGVVLSEQSVVATDQNTMRVLAVGAEAKKMVGRTPSNITAMRPLRDGVIADFDTVETMLQYFHRPRARRDAVRTASARDRRRAFGGHRGREARGPRGSLQAGAREVYLIEEPMAAPLAPGSRFKRPPAT